MFGKIVGWVLLNIILNIRYILISIDLLNLILSIKDNIKMFI